MGKHQAAEQRYIAREAKLDREQPLTIGDRLRSRTDEPLLRAITLYVTAAHHAELTQAENLIKVHSPLFRDLSFLGETMRQELRLQAAGELDNQT